MLWELQVGSQRVESETGPADGDELRAGRDGLPADCVILFNYADTGATYATMGVRYRF